MDIGKVFMFCFFTFFTLQLFAEDHFRLVITGDMMGAINECDCPGGQPGGLARRKSIIDAIRVETPDAVFIDCGILFKDLISSDELNLAIKLLEMLDYNLISSTEYDNNILSNSDDTNTFNFSNFLQNKKLKLFDGQMSIATLSETDVVANNWKSSISQTGISIIISNEDIADGSISITDNKDEVLLPLDIVIFYGSGYIEADVESHLMNWVNKDGTKITKELLIARPSMYGEYVLVIDLWTENGNEISRYEWEAIPSEIYPPDSTFQAKIDFIYKDNVDSRKK